METHNHNYLGSSKFEQFEVGKTHKLFEKSRARVKHIWAFKKVQMHYFKIKRKICQSYKAFQGETMMTP